MDVTPKAKDLRKHADLTQDVLNAQKILLLSVKNEEGKKIFDNFQVFTDNDDTLQLKSRLANEDNHLNSLFR